MKKLLVIFGLIIGLQSCLTIGRIERNCDKFAKLCVTDRETTTIYRDTTIYQRDTILVPLPYRDTVRITDTVRIVNNQAFLKPVHKEFGLIGVDAWVQFSVLGVKAYLTDSTILHVRNDTIFLEKVIKEAAITKTVTVRHVPGFYKFTFWMVIAQVAFLMVFLVKQWLF